MASFRRDPRVSFLLVLGAIFFLVAILKYNGRERGVTFVKEGDQAPTDTGADAVQTGTGTPVKDPWRTGDEDTFDQPPQGNGGDNSLAPTTEETVIPSVPLPHNPSILQKAYVEGFVMLDRLYLRNGTFYVVTKDPNFPPRKDLIAKWFEVGQGLNLDATDEELQFLTPEQAPEVLGEYATRISGFTVIDYDPSQFMSHFYHWWGEIILGMWRVYSSLALGSSKYTSGRGSHLPFPSRFLLPAIATDAWRDRAGVIGPLMRAAFPQTPIEKADYWNDLVKLNTTVVFDRSMIINRENAHHHPNSGLWFKMIAGTMNLTVPDYYWEPVRRSLVQNTIGYIPVIDSRARILTASLKPSPVPFQQLDRDVDRDERERYDKPVLTYISRQGAGRKLVDSDHLRLVESLKALETEGLCTLQIPMMERLSIKEQVALMAKTTILVGVHGNGLTHQLLMPPSLRSAVFEIWDPPSYTFDYEMLARNMGHKHYGVHNDSLITYPKGKYHQGVDFTEGFHGNFIPVYGPVIADMIKRRLTEPDEAVED